MAATDAQAISAVALELAASLRAFANFFCKETTAPAASQYSLRMFKSVSMDLQDLWMSPRSAKAGVVCEEDILIEQIAGTRIETSSTFFQGQDWGEEVHQRCQN